MLLDDYQLKACRTATFPEDRAVEYLSLGLVSELGEVAGVMKKHIRGDFNDDEMCLKISKELGDCFWYSAVLARRLGVSFSTVCGVSDTIGLTIDVKRKPRIALDYAVKFASGLYQSDYKIGVLSLIMPYLVELVRIYNLSIHETLTANLEKLAARKANGTIKGSGDDR